MGRGEEGAAVGGGGRGRRINRRWSQRGEVVKMALGKKMMKKTVPGKRRL